MDARLARIEAKLDAFRSAESTVCLDRPCERNATNEKALDIPLGSEIEHTPSPAGWVSSKSRSVPAVPLLTEALPVIEAYFQNYNSLIPLFNQQSFVSGHPAFLRSLG